MSNLFAALSPILNHATLALMVSKDADDRIVTIVIPKPKADNPHEALTRPIKVSGTPEEMDDAIIAGLTTYAKGYADVAETFAAVAALQEAAKKEALDKTKAPKAGAASTTAPAAKTTGRNASKNVTVTKPTEPAASATAKETTEVVAEVPVKTPATEPAASKKNLFEL